MKKWQCKVCNYTHSGDTLPESCPVCGVYRDAFILLEDDEKGAAVDTENSAGKASEVIIQKKCSVCGYIKRDDDPGDNCPVCGISADHFQDITSSPPVIKRATEADDDSSETEDVEKKWKCTVCGYIHTGPEPPDKCPVCGADRSLFVLLEPKVETETEPEQEKPVPPAADKKETSDAPETNKHPPADSKPSLTSTSPGFYTTITTQMSKWHGHPISVHIPNGVLPVAFLFYVLGILFNSDTLLLVSHYNLIFVLISMPMVLFSGYNDWQIRLGGNMTRVIKTKMICGAIVTIVSLILVLWRWVNPDVAEQWSSGRFIFGAFFAIALVAAAVAGFYGGKLIRFPGDNKF